MKNSRSNKGNGKVKNFDLQDEIINFQTCSQGFRKLAKLMGVRKFSITEDTIKDGNKIIPNSSLDIPVKGSLEGFNVGVFCENRRVSGGTVWENPIIIGNPWIYDKTDSKRMIDLATRLEAIFSGIKFIRDDGWMEGNIEDVKEWLSEEN